MRITSEARSRDRAEGLAREFVNRVQNARKDAGFAVTDRIRIRVEAGEKLAGGLRGLSAYICRETLADDLSVGVGPGAPAGAWPSPRSGSIWLILKNPSDVEI